MASAARRVCAAVAAATTGLWLSAANAQSQPAGFAVDRYDPSERGSDWFANESLDLRGHLRPSAGVVFDYAYKPLVLNDPSGSAKLDVLRHQLFAHVGGAVTLVDRVRVGVSVPV